MFGRGERLGCSIGKFVTYEAKQSIVNLLANEANFGKFINFVISKDINMDAYF